jgi:phytanoyl-CoA hydroxylase
MLAAFDDVGVLILRDFVAVEQCRVLTKRALELVDDFDPEEVRSVFSTTSQTQLNDSYFIESGDKIRFFLEEDAFDESGHLRQSKIDSLNKIGHAMHDLDPVFDHFSRTPQLAGVAERLGLRGRLPPGRDLYLYGTRVVHRLLVCARGRNDREWLYVFHSRRPQDESEATQLSRQRE